MVSNVFHSMSISLLCFQRLYYTVVESRKVSCRVSKRPAANAIHSMLHNTAGLADSMLCSSSKSVRARKALFDKWKARSAYDKPGFLVSKHQPTPTYLFRMTATTGRSLLTSHIATFLCTRWRRRRCIVLGWWWWRRCFLRLTIAPTADRTLTVALLRLLLLLLLLLLSIVC